VQLYVPSQGTEPRRLVAIMIINTICNLTICIITPSIQIPNTSRGNTSPMYLSKQNKGILAEGIVSVGHRRGGLATLPEIIGISNSGRDCVQTLVIPCFRPHSARISKADCLSSSSKAQRHVVLRERSSSTFLHCRSH
jgi:hypothetical protein